MSPARSRIRRARPPAPRPRTVGTAGTRGLSSCMIHRPAPVAQWIEQVPSKHLAAGSSPAGGALLHPALPQVRDAIRPPVGLPTAPGHRRPRIDPAQPHSLSSPHVSAGQQGGTGASALARSAAGSSHRGQLQQAAGHPRKARRSEGARAYSSCGDGLKSGSWPIGPSASCAVDSEALLCSRCCATQLTTSRKAATCCRARVSASGPEPC